MTIYSPSNYRKIYEQHYGPIPKDSDGRTYDIHHIDGNHLNNDPKNLKAVSIKEHYDIHYSQCDWGACVLIGKRMNQSPEEISEIARRHNLNRMRDGTHPWANGGIKEIQRVMIENGTHPFLSGELQRNTQQRLVEQGTHHFLGDGSFQRKVQQKRIDEGTHNFAGDRGSKHSTELNLRLLSEGRHPSQSPEARAKMKFPKKKVTCPHCNKQMAPHLLSRFHGDKCKSLSMPN